MQITVGKRNWGMGGLGINENMEMGEKWYEDLCGLGTLGMAGRHLVILITAVTVSPLLSTVSYGRFF
jgi:hypothetical protein